MELVRRHTGEWSWWLPAAAATACFIAGILLEEKWLFALPFIGLAIPVILKLEIRNVYFLLLFFLPLSTEVSIGASFSTDLPDELLMLTITGALIGYFILKNKLFPVEAKESSLFVILLLQMMWMLVTIFFSHNAIISTKYLLAKIWYIVPFVLGTLLFLRTQADFAKASRLLVFSMAIPVVVSLVRHAGHGFTFESVYLTMDPFFRNHVTYSALIVCLLPILAAWQYFAVGWVRTFVVLLIVLFLLALFFAYSRGAWICLVTGGIAFWAIRKKLMLWLIIASMAVTVAGVGWLLKDDNYMKFAPDFNTTYFRTDFGDHMAATYQLKDISTMERVYRWVAGVRMVKEEWLTGFGPNNFYNNYKKYTVAAFKTWVSENKERSSVHNYFLLVTIEQGFPGLLLFCWLLYVMFQTSMRAFHRLKNPFDKTVAMLCGVVLTMIITLNLLSDLIETDKIGGLFFLILGLLMQLQFKMNRQQEPSAPAN